jgi:hypothetical protein
MGEKASEFISSLFTDDEETVLSSFVVQAERYVCVK